MKHNYEIETSEDNPGLIKWICAQCGMSEDDIQHFGVKHCSHWSVLVYVRKWLISKKRSFWRRCEKYCKTRMT